MPLELAGFVAGLAYSWLLGRISANGASRFRKLAGLSGLAVAAACLVAMFAGSVWTTLAVCFGFGWGLGDMPGTITELRRRRKLEDMVASWWRKEIGADDLKDMLAEHGISQKVYVAMKTDLRRRFGESFMQAFEVQFGFAGDASQGEAAQPIG